MKRLIILPLVIASCFSAVAQSGYFNSSSNSGLLPSTLSMDYHLRHYQPQVIQKEGSSNIYDTIDNYTRMRNFELLDNSRYNINRRFIYHPPINNVDHENQKINNNGNGNLNNTNSYRP
jgi:hypothetical protein